jgi:peptidoglycan/xylan/chitin deacetylase (PgdA/CDA1 family)
VLIVSLVSRPSAGAEPTVVSHGPRDAPRVALTFDLCPTRPTMELDDRIVDALVARRAHATFFVSGRWARAEPDAVRRLAREPLFEIGNHSYHHPHLGRLADEAIRQELVITQDALRDLGATSRVFRAPFGEVDARIARIAADVGLRTIEYDVISGDPGATATRSWLVRTVVGHARPGSIVIMHANHRRFATADAVPEIVDGLRARGFQLVTVSELLAPAGPVEPVR